MLCGLCADIDMDMVLTADGYKHHATLEDLSASAQQGCEFCAMIEVETRFNTRGFGDLGPFSHIAILANEGNQAGPFRLDRLEVRRAGRC